MIGHARNQYIAALLANLVAIGFGCSIAWLSPALPLLLSSDTPLSSGPLTTEQLSWSGSVSSIGGAIGSTLFGCLMDQIGTKRSLLLLVIPQILSWSLLVVGTVAEYIIVSRFLSGLVGGGAIVCTAIYFAEIANDDIRGRLSTSYALSRNFGILLSYVLGIYMNYIHASMICLVIAVLFAVSFTFMPATPQHLLRRGAIDEARKAFRFYKGCINQELNVDIDSAFERLQMISKQSKEGTKLSWKDIIEPTACKGLLICIVLSLLSQSCGVFVFVVYASTIFARSGTYVSPELASIVLALVQIVGTLLAARFIETQGRKPLLIISLVGCTCGLLAMSAFLYCSTLALDVSMFQWVPVVSLGFVILISAAGITPLSVTCSVEALPTKVRSFGLTVGSLAMNVFSFFILASYPSLLESVDLHGCMLMYAATCVFGTAFVVVYVDETKGVALDQPNKETSDNNECEIA